MFCRTRHGANRLAKQLSHLDIKVATIHGSRSQNQRARALDEFASGRVQALVATDVAARGIHVDGVAVVLHYDFCADPKTYVHRSGRTARAGHEGLVVSLVQPEESRDARSLNRGLGINGSVTRPDLSTLSGFVPETVSSPQNHVQDVTRRSFSKTTGHSSSQRKRRRHRRRFKRSAGQDLKGRGVRSDNGLDRFSGG